MSDWVDPIAKIATEWTNTHLKQFEWADFVANHVVVLFLLRAERAETKPRIELLIKRFIDVIAAGTAQDYFVLPLSLRRLIYAFDQKHTHLLRAFSLQDPVAIVRTSLLRIRDVVLTDQEHSLYQSDTSSTVRKQYFQWLLRSGHKVPQANLERLVYAKIKSVCEMGGFYLQQQYGIDRYDLYKQAIDSNYYWIADFAKQEDYPHFLAGLKEQSRDIRIACLMGIKKTYPETVCNFDLVALIQAGSKYRKILTDWLPSQLTTDGLLALRPTYELAGDSATMSYFHLLSKNSYWDFVDLAIQLHDQSALSDVLMRCLQRIRPHDTLGSNYTQPRSGELKARLVGALSNSPDRYKGIGLDGRAILWRLQAGR